MQNLWFTSDTHWGHKNVIDHCDRPWSDVGEMNEALVANWNARVDPNDIVWHLGDVTLHKDPTKWLTRLNGKIHVCFGNHDSIKDLKRCRDEGIIEWCGDVRYLRWEGERFFLSHYAHRVWNGSHRGVYHLYGHSHGDLPDMGRSMDVGVDAVGYTPVSATWVINKLGDKDITNHHID